MCKIKLQDIGGESCEPISGLFSEQIKIAPFADFAVIQEIPDIESTNITPETAAVIALTHTFKTGKGFTNIEGVTEGASLKCNMAGEIGRRIFTNELVVEVAGSNAAILGTLRLIKNLKFIMLAQEIGNGNWRQFGSKRQPARFSGIEQAIEAAMEGKNSVTLTIQDKQVCPAPVYTGDIDLTVDSE